MTERSLRDTPASEFDDELAAAVNDAIEILKISKGSSRVPLTVRQAISLLDDIGFFDADSYADTEEDKES